MHGEHWVSLHRVRADRIGIIGAPPTHAVVGRPTRIDVAAVDSAGRVDIYAVAWMAFTKRTCTNGASVSARNATISGGVAAHADLVFAGVGMCGVSVTVPSGYPQWLHPTTNMPYFEVVVQQPVEVVMVANITSDAVPVLRAGIAYPLLVRVVDDAGATVLGDD